MKKYEDNYSPDGKILWDSWFIKTNSVYHLFYLQADRIDGVDYRYSNAISVGHATSKDFFAWKQLPDALKFSVGDYWDNKDIWSGCIAEKDGVYYLYYTGKNDSLYNENIQKIGVAVSKDLNIWTKYSENPILEADLKYYNMSNGKNAIGNIDAWRDPYVFKDIASDKRYMTISARINNGSNEYNACVALAESDDMIHWNVLPPIFSPGVYDEIEVTKIIYYNKYYYLFFSTHASNYKPEFAMQNGTHEGLHCYYSDSLFGGYKPVNGNGGVLKNMYNVYNIRILNLDGDGFIGIGCLNLDKDGNFIGKLAHPVKIQIDKDRVYKIEE